MSIAAAGSIRPANNNMREAPAMTDIPSLPRPHPLAALL